MFSTSDTIVAIATPPGRGGIGVVRLSGPDARRITACMITHDGSLEPRRATFTKVRLEGSVVDHVVAIYYPAPRMPVCSSILARACLAERGGCFRKYSSKEASCSIKVLWG